MTRSLLFLGLALFVTACGGSGADPTPVATPTPTPAPLPTPTPTPTPEPTPAPSFAADLRMHGNAECPKGRNARQDGSLPVGCSVEVRVSYHYPDGNEVPSRTLGQATIWAVEEGGEHIDMPLIDENPWRRWITARSPGDYTISVTITSQRGGETVVGTLSNRVIPD
jgi:hypothetical protein